MSTQVLCDYPETECPPTPWVHSSPPLPDTHSTCMCTASLTGSGLTCGSHRRRSRETNSQIVHLTADAPMGPFTRQDVFAPPFAHEPDVVRDPSTGRWVMTYSAYNNISHQSAGMGYHDAVSERSQTHTPPCTNARSTCVAHLTGRGVCLETLTTGLRRQRDIPRLPRSSREPELISAPPCKMHTVPVWRISRGEKRLSRSAQTVRTAHRPLKVRRAAPFSEGTPPVWAMLWCR